MAGAEEKKSTEEQVSAPETKSLNLFGSSKTLTSTNIFKLAPGQKCLFGTNNEENSAASLDKATKSFNAATLFGTTYNLGKDANKHSSAPFFALKQPNIFIDAKKKKQESAAAEEQEKKEEERKQESKKTVVKSDSDFEKLFTVAVGSFMAGSENKGQGTLSFEVIGANKDVKPVAGDPLKSAVLVLRNSMGKTRFQGVMLKKLTRLEAYDKVPGKISSLLYIPSYNAEKQMKIVRCLLKFKYAWDRTEMEEAFKTVFSALPDA